MPCKQYAISRVLLDLADRCAETTDEHGWRPSERCQEHDPVGERRMAWIWESKPHTVSTSGRFHFWAQRQQPKSLISTSLCILLYLLPSAFLMQAIRRMISRSAIRVPHACSMPRCERVVRQARALSLGPSRHLIACRPNSRDKLHERGREGVWRKRLAELPISDRRGRGAGGLQRARDVLK